MYTVVRFEDSRMPPTLFDVQKLRFFYVKSIRCVRTLCGIKYFKKNKRLTFLFFFLVKGEGAQRFWVFTSSLDEHVNIICFVHRIELMIILKTTSRFAAADHVIIIRQRSDDINSLANQPNGALSAYIRI